MFIGFTPFTYVHVIISLVGLISGVVVLRGLLRAERDDRWTIVFLVSTVLTNATSFGFPFFRVLPSHIIAGLSLVILAVAIVARYPKRLDGSWRWIYTVSAVTALYFNFFVLITQLFRRVPSLAVLAPTQTEPPFAIAQGLLLVAFIVLGVRAVKRFRPAASHAGAAHAG